MRSSERWLSRMNPLLGVAAGLFFIGPKVLLSAPPMPVTVSNSGPEWASSYFAVRQTGTFTAEVDAIPLSSAVDGGIALSEGAQSAFAGLACIARFNTAGFIDARDGAAYSATASVRYIANATYHLRFVVNLPSHTYSVYVTPPGSSEQSVAINYAFRTEQESVTVLNTWSLFADVGSIRVQNFSAGSSTAVANSV